VSHDFDRGVLLRWSFDVEIQQGSVFRLCQSLMSCLTCFAWELLSIV